MGECLNCKDNKSLIFARKMLSSSSDESFKLQPRQASQGRLAPLKRLKRLEVLMKR